MSCRSCIMNKNTGDGLCPGFTPDTTLSFCKAEVPKPFDAKVVHVLKDEWDVYIGRASHIKNLPQSKWANPFHIGDDGSRERVIEKYEKYVKLQPELMAALPELKGKRLGCWCNPKPCHGDVLLRLAYTEVDGSN